MAQWTFASKPEATVGAIRRAENEDVDLGQVRYERLCEGEGRLGRGHEKSGDPGVLARKERQQGGDAFIDDGKECWHPFSLEIEPCDRVVCVDVPE